MTRDDFGKAISALCCGKLSTTLTASQLEVWYGVIVGLGFRRQVINYAVIELIGSRKRFPELADFIQICRRLQPAETEYAPNRDPERLTRSEVLRIAAALGLEV